ncbi:hypothetical protein ZYGM_004547 [Zygosaccharomyces mellis]|uniref:Agglutinin-like protein N-terminal domain-containing protein n=1 Tax=Zygosaccharomyces mellis TaxID=42258 RepID=A0A4C2E348_9SACH|nr:hypothetical protein ZYGM_004547 [Zygosaccharomyces mellis]
MYKNFNSIRLILLTFCLVWRASAKEINTISFSGLTFTPLSSLHYPHQGWSTSFDFKIDDGSSVSKDDYFSLSFPTVYRIKFDDNKLTTNATLQDGSEAFECVAAQQAAYKNKDTIFKCVAIRDLSSYSSLSGSLSFGLSFSSGGSAYQYEMQNADKFHSGSMQVLLADQLSAPIQFDSANFTKDIYTIGRSTTFNSLESYYLGMSCPNGYLLGGTQTINYDRENKGYDLDCSSIQVHLSDEYNDWSLPLKDDDAGAKVDCSDDTLKINMGQASANQMLWVNALQDVSDGINTIQHEVHLQYSCSNTEQKTTYETQFSTVVEYMIYQASGTGTLSGLTATPVPSSSSAVTIQTITSTTTTGWTGAYNTTYSTGSTGLSGSGGVPTDEIIYYVETPSESKTSASETSVPKTSAPETITTTTTTGWTGAYNTTYSTGSTGLSGSSGVPTDEIIYYVETPDTQLYQITTKLVTISRTTTIGWSGTYSSTYSTGSTTFGSNNGTLTRETIYYVETPTTSVLPLSSEVTLTSAIPQLVTLSTSDLNSTYITTCNSLKSVSTANWLSSNSETITPKPGVRTNHSSTRHITKSVTTHSPKNSPTLSTPASGISSASISRFSPHVTNRSWPLTFTQPTYAVFSQSSSVIFASTALSSVSVPFSRVSTISNIKHSTNLTGVVATTPTSRTSSNASATYTSTVRSPVNSTPLTNPVGAFSASTSISISTNSRTPLTINSSSAAESLSSSKLPSQLTAVSTMLTAYTNTVSSPASSTLPFNFSSAAAVSDISNPTIPFASSSSGRFSLGLSLDQGSMAQTPVAQSSTHCSISTDISTNIVTVTKNSTITKYATASVTHTVTHKVNNYNCSTETVQSLLKPYSSSSSSNTSPSLAAYSGKGFILKRTNSITALLAMLLFIL